MEAQKAYGMVCHRTLGTQYHPDMGWYTKNQNCLVGSCMAWEWMADHELVEGEGFPYKRAKYDKYGDIIPSTTEGRCLDLVR